MAVAGVVITVIGSAGIGGGHILGDMAAIYMTCTMAMMTVIMRRHREVPMLESAAMSGFVAAALSFFFCDPMTATLTQIGWLALFGIVTQGAGLGIYTMGARRLPSAQAALLSASEVPLSPLWVWIFFAEVPALATFIGGGLVLAAILWNVGAELRKSRAKPVQKNVAALARLLAGEPRATTSLNGRPPLRGRRRPTNGRSRCRAAFRTCPRRTGTIEAMACSARQAPVPAN